MINDIIDAMCTTLRNLFGEECGIYTEQVKQGMKEPCFFISTLQPDNKQNLTYQRKWSHMINVQYFAGSDEPKAECNDVYEKMITLEQLTVNGRIIHGELECKTITDGVMTITATYSGLYLKKDKEEMMEEIHWKGVSNGQKGK